MNRKSFQEWYDKYLFSVALLVFIIAFACVTTLKGVVDYSVLKEQDNAKAEHLMTDGFLNGNGWNALKAEDKNTYMVGFQEGIIEIIINVPGETKVPGFVVADGLTGAVAIRALDVFYQDKVNLKIPVLAGYIYISKVYVHENDEAAKYLLHCQEKANGPSI